MKNEISLFLLYFNLKCRLMSVCSFSSVKRASTLRVCLVPSRLVALCVSPIFVPRSRSARCGEVGGGRLRLLSENIGTFRRRTRTFIPFRRVCCCVCFSDGRQANDKHRRKHVLKELDFTIKSGVVTVFYLN